MASARIIFVHQQYVMYHYGLVMKCVSKHCKTIIFSVVLYGYEARSVMLNEEHRGYLGTLY
jgi:hypothetical protein